MSMHDPELYQKCNSIQRLHAEECLKAFGSKMEWKKNCEIIDIGSGDGSVTSNILKKYAPSDFGKIVGCDISEEMVKFANDKHGDERVTFTTIDIAGDMPENLREKFDHAFSSYCLQLVYDQKKAIQNIFELLSDGGNCLLMFFCHNPLFKVFYEMSKRTKWQLWLKNIYYILPEHHEFENPTIEVKNMMEDTGFVNVEVHCTNKTFVFDSIEDLRKMLQSINLFKLPPGPVLDEFLDDFTELVFEMKALKKEQNSENVGHYFCQIIAYGCKCYDR